MSVQRVGAARDGLQPLSRHPGPHRQLLRPAAAGQVEVLNDTTPLLRLDPEEQPQGEADEDSLMLGLFLDFLSRQALTAEQGPVPYTEAMAAEDEELLAGVTVDAADETGGA